MGSEWETGEVRVFGLRRRYALPLVAVLLAGAVAGVVALVLSGTYLIALALRGLVILLVPFQRFWMRHSGLIYLGPGYWHELQYKKKLQSLERPGFGRDRAKVPPEPPSPDQLP